MGVFGPVAAPRAGDAPADFSDATQQFDLAGGLLNRGVHDEAAAQFDRFLERFPDDARRPEAHLWRGEARFQQREFLSAAHDFYAFVAARDKGGPPALLAFARIRYGACLFELKHYENAVRTLAPLLDHPSASDALRKTAAYYAGLAYFALGRAVEAEAALARVDEGPLTAHALFSRAEVVASRGRHRDAADLFARYADTFAASPLAAEARLRQADEWRRAGRYDDAEPLLATFLQPAASTDPTVEGTTVSSGVVEERAARAGFSLARLRLDQGRPDDARRVADETARRATAARRPELATEAYFIAGHAALAERKFADAAESFARVVDGPLAAEAARRRAWAWLLAGRPDDAQTALNEALETSPDAADPAESAYLQGRVAAARSVWPEAARHFESARDRARAEADHARAEKADDGFIRIRQRLAADAAYELAFALDRQSQWGGAADAYAVAASLYAPLVAVSTAPPADSTTPPPQTAPSNEGTAAPPSPGGPADPSATERSPAERRADALAGQGRALIHAERLEEALAAYAAFLDATRAFIDPADPARAAPWEAARLSAMAQQAACYYRLKQYANMESTYTQLIDADTASRQRTGDAAPSPLVGEAWYWLGWRAATRKAFGEAAALYGRTADTFADGPLAASARHRQALCLFQNGQAAESAATFLRLLKDHPDADIEHRELLWLGQWLTAQQRDADAFPVYAALLARKPSTNDRAYALYWQAEIRRRARAFEEARALYDAALEARVDDVAIPARYGRAVVLREAGHIREAREAVDQLADGLPGDDPLGMALKYQSGLLSLAEGKVEDGLTSLLFVGMFCADASMAGDALWQAGEAAAGAGDRRRAVLCFADLAGETEDSFGKRHPDDPHVAQARERLAALRAATPTP